MTVTVLVENTGPVEATGLRPEHGLSLHVTTDGLTLLHDLGATGRFAENAAALGIALAGVDLAVVSHGHFDHGGGLQRFFELNARAPVYLRRGAEEPHYRRSLFGPREVGIPRETLAGRADRLRFVDEGVEPARDVHLVTGIGRAHPWVKFNRMLIAERGGKMVPDPLDHELVLVVRRPDGLVVFTGCGHNGVLNMLDAVIARFPGTPITAVIGGFHLGGIPGTGYLAESAASVRRVGEGLLARGVRQTWTGHCTGTQACRTLRSVMGDSLQLLTTGLQIRL